MTRVTILLPVVIGYLVGAPPALAWTWPVGGPVLQHFAIGSDPYAAGQHRGIDIGAPPGAVVAAPAGGVVSFAGTVPSGGRTITIKTQDGYAATLQHLGSFEVSKGMVVAEGQALGTVGPSEGSETPAHVHLGIRVASDPNGYLDPLTLLPRPGAQPQTAEPQLVEESDDTVAESAPAAAGTSNGDAAATLPADGPADPPSVVPAAGSVAADTPSLPGEGAAEQQATPSAGAVVTLGASTVALSGPGSQAPDAAASPGTKPGAERPRALRIDASSPPRRATEGARTRSSELVVQARQRAVGDEPGSRRGSAPVVLSTPVERDRRIGSTDAGLAAPTAPGSVGRMPVAALALGAVLVLLVAAVSTLSRRLPPPGGRRAGGCGTPPPEIDCSGSSSGAVPRPAPARSASRNGARGGPRTAPSRVRPRVRERSRPSV
jgi:hypothetical protein